MHSCIASKRQPCSTQVACSSCLQGTLRSHHEVWGNCCRLDEVTSGILLLGRTKHAAGKICAAFAEGRVHKCYIALSDRKPKKKQGTIRGDMAKARRGSWKLLHSTHDPAITTFTSSAVTGNRLGLRAYFVKPLTGRTHQIRVAMKSIGVPILGDTRYADKGAASQEDRTYLHASAVKFKLNGQKFRVVCPPDVGLEFLTPAFQSVWQENSPGFLNHEW